MKLNGAEDDVPDRYKLFLSGKVAVTMPSK